MKRRPYTLRRRAERQAETRRRIVEAAVELHRTVGPARTTFSAVAELAGVQRHTLYRHFPDEASVLRACSEHYLGAHPPPAIARWRALRPGRERLRAGLGELYAYFAANQQMMANVLRDAEVMPVGAGFRAGIERAAQALADGWRARDRAGLDAMLRVATEFDTWRILAERSSLPALAAAKLMSRLVECAAQGSRARRPHVRK